MSRVGLVLAAALMASGCAVSISGSAAPAPSTPPPTTAAARKQPVDPDHLTAEAVLGDLLFVNLCEFLRLDDLKSFGKAEFASPGGFDACGIDITRPDGLTLAVTVGDIDVGMGTHPESVALAGGLRSFPLDSAPGSCSLVLEFPDDVSLSVDVLAEDDGGDMCPVAHKAIEAMVGRFPDGIESTREIPANSLARVDACAVLPESVVAEVPGLRAGAKDEVLTKHVCGYGSPSDTAPYLSLRLVVGYPPTEDDDFAAETVAGRETLVYQPKDEPENGLVTCSAVTDHQRFPLPRVPGVRELAIVSVWVKEADARTGCPQAKAIAAKVWPRLPRS